MSELQVESVLSCRSSDENYILKVYAQKQIAPPGLLFGDLSAGLSCFQELASAQPYSIEPKVSSPEHSHSQKEQLNQEPEQAENDDNQVRVEEEMRLDRSSILPLEDRRPAEETSKVGVDRNLIQEGNPQAFMHQNDNLIQSSQPDQQFENQEAIRLDELSRRQRKMEEKVLEDELHLQEERQPVENVNEEPYASTSAILRALQSEQRRQLTTNFDPSSLNNIQQQLANLISQISQDRLAASQFAQDLARSSQQKISAVIASKSASSHREMLQEQREIKRLLVQLTRKMVESDKKIDRLDKKVDQLIDLVRQNKK